MIYIRTLKYAAASMLAVLLFLSCKKDRGNYHYTDVNALLFQHIDTTNGYTVYLGETLKIDPGIKGTSGEPRDYSCVWYIDHGVGSREVVAESKVLDMVAAINPGVYRFVLSAKDNETGISWQQAFQVKVVTPYYEGYFVLSEVNNESRLDFISYMDGSFAVHKDLREKLNIGLPRGGKPRQVLFATFTRTQHFCYLEENATSLLGTETFNYYPYSDISYQFIDKDKVPAGFAAEKIIYAGGLTPRAFLCKGGYMYHDAYEAPPHFNYALPMNRYADNAQIFPAAPFKASDYYSNNVVIMFDTHNRRFVSRILNEAGARQLAPSLNFPEGYDLLYMTENGMIPYLGNSYGYAVIRHPSTGEIRMIRFEFIVDFWGGTTPMPAVDRNVAVAGPGIAGAEHFAVSPDLGYLFYTVGGKLYEFDLFLETSKLMLDAGADRITMLRFDELAGNGWKNRLLVATYNPSGEEGNNGTLTQYTVPPVNGALVKENTWTGFGKVVSSAYRFR